LAGVSAGGAGRKGNHRNRSGTRSGRRDRGLLVLLVVRFSETIGAICDEENQAFVAIVCSRENKRQNR